MTAYETCEFKMSFLSKKEAEAHTEAYHKKNNTLFPLFVYHCPICNGWHLTKEAQVNRR